MRSPRLSLQTVMVLLEFTGAPGKWRYGYDLIKATELAAGTLYPILARLSDAGWLESQWETASEDGRPPRHQYRLTAQGRAEAREMVKRAASTRMVKKYS